MWFDSWSGIGRTIVAGVVAYAALVVILRISGKRTLSKMNAFDFVVTVALGSSLATVLLSKDVALLEGLAAFSVLAGMQYLVAWVSSRSSAIEGAIKSSPVLLNYRGELDTVRLPRERLTAGEVRAAVRKQGLASMDGVEAVVLEAAGELSVLKKGEYSATALEGVTGATGKQQ